MLCIRRMEMTEHIREYEDALFKAAIYEMAKDESKVLVDKMNLQEAEAPSELLDKRVHNMMTTELKKSRTKKHAKQRCALLLSLWQS